MRDIMWFAIHSARREAEICRLEWADNDADARIGLVRDAKHPTAKEGNHRPFKYTSEAWAIAERQPRTSEYVFPYDPRSIGAAFTRGAASLDRLLAYVLEVESRVVDVNGDGMDL